MMNKLLILLSICSLIFLGCNNDDETITPEDHSTTYSLNKIMPLGASRVEGARPIFESYRFQLWKRLIDNGFEFDYIGTMDDEASYPIYAGQSFDVDHEGRGGWTSGQILSEIQSWLDEAGIPDIVLFSSPGGNDALGNLSYDEAINNVNAIIDIVQAANPSVTIIIEQMAPARSDLMTPTLTTYFENIQNEVVTIATQQSTATSQVLTVDMATGFGDSFLADDVHYNEAGADFIAERYFDVLLNVLER